MNPFGLLSVLFLIFHCANGEEAACPLNRCQHFCKQDSGQHTCTCATGYTLQSDGRSCKLEMPEAGQLVYSVGNQMRRSNLKTHESSVMGKTLAGNMEKVAINYPNSTYYIAGGKLHAMEPRRACLVEGLTEGANMAVDWVTGNIYYTNEMPAALGLCKSDGRFCASLFSQGDGLHAPRGIAVAPKLGLMFWTDCETQSRLGRANMDGTQRTVIVKDGLDWPNAITIDYVRNIIYFADSQLERIERCGMDGSNREVVVHGRNMHPYDLVVFDGSVYWTDWSQGVMMANVSDGSRVCVQEKNIEQPYGLTIFHPHYQEQNLPNPCLNSSCSHICALTRSGAGDGVAAVCLCPSGYQFRPGSSSQCLPTADVTNGTKPTMKADWCQAAFEEACGSEEPCENGGKCKMEEEDEYGLTVRVHCECPRNYTGKYCEVVSFGGNVQEDTKLNGVEMAIERSDAQQMHQVRQRLDERKYQVYTQQNLIQHSNVTTSNDKPEEEGWKNLNDMLDEMYDALEIEYEEESSQKLPEGEDQLEEQNGQEGQRKAAQQENGTIDQLEPQKQEETPVGDEQHSTKIYSEQVTIVNQEGLAMKKQSQVSQKQENLESLILPDSETIHNEQEQTNATHGLNQEPIPEQEENQLEVFQQEPNKQVEKNEDSIREQKLPTPFPKESDANAATSLTMTHNNRRTVCMILLVFCTFVLQRFYF